MICFRSVDEVCPSGQGSVGNGLAKSLWPEHGTALLLKFLSHTANCSSISKSQVQTSDKAEGACSETNSTGCTNVPKNDLCMSDDICARVDVGEQKWCYFEVKRHSLKHVCGFLLFKSLQYMLSELWHLGQQCSSSPLLHLGVSSHWAQVRTNKQVRRSAESYHNCRGKNLELFRNAQGSSSKDVVLQGTFCLWSGMEKRKRQKERNKQSEKKVC